MSTVSSEVSEAASHDPQRLRAKLKVFKRKVEAAEGRVREKEDAITAKQREVDVKEKIIAERDKVHNRMFEWFFS